MANDDYTDNFEHSEHILWT